MAKKKPTKAKDEEKEEEKHEADSKEKGGKKDDKKSKKKTGWKEALAAEEEEARLKKEKEDAIKNRPAKFVVARHILVEDQEKAQEIYDKIYEEFKDEPIAGAFGKYAKEHSIWDSKSKGGKLGAFGRGKMAIEFEEAAFNTQPGKMTKVIHTEFGYHIILVEEHKK